MIPRHRRCSRSTRSFFALQQRCRRHDPSSLRALLTGDADTEPLGSPAPARGVRGLLLAGRQSQSLVSLASFVVSFLALTALVPVLVRQLGARDYGVWVLTGGIANWVLVFDFGLSLSVSRFVALERNRARDQAEEAITVG